MGRDGRRVFQWLPAACAAAQLSRPIPAEEPPRCEAGGARAVGVPSNPFVACLTWCAHLPMPMAVHGSSLNGLNTFSPGRLKSWSLPVAIVSPWRRAVAAM
jgi:hypothetical protein